uniref:DNA-directed RNA polymerase subunit beta n=1 Tax=Panagrellus redivivus TaxID=6233 RepID=A0A7E4ZYZ0_PANRE
MIKDEILSSDEDPTNGPTSILHNPLRKPDIKKFELPEEDTLDQVEPFVDESTDDDDDADPRYFESQHPVLEHERKHVCHHSPAAPQPAIPDKWKLVPAFLHNRGLAHQHIHSFNYFVDEEICKILAANNYITSDANPNWFLKYRKIWVGRCNYEEDMTAINDKITPQECRLRDITYSAPIFVDLEYTRGNQRVLRRALTIGRMPIMVRSNRCALWQMETLEDMAKTRECAYDPGGYFIIRGTEKVVLMHEQMAKNRIMINRNSKKELVCEVMSSTSQRKSKTYVCNKKGKYYVQHNQLGEDIPVIVLFKALGMESDADVISLIGSQEYFIGAIGASVIEGNTLRIRSTEEAVQYIAGKVKLRRMRGGAEMRTHDALDFLTNSFIAHIPCSDGSMLMKAVYLGLMVRRLIEAEVGVFSEDDRDFYGNKRIELAGSMLSLLFEDLFKRFNMELKRVADTHLTRNLATPLDITKHIRQDFITSGLTYALSTGNWIIKRFKMQRMGVTQVLCRLSYISVLGMMSRINSTFERTRKVSGPRSLQPSQWGMLCPCDTPEGESCGLVKSLALMCHITTDSDDEQIKRLMFNCGVESMRYNKVSAIHQSHMYTAFLNGNLVGLTSDPLKLALAIRQMRRRGYINRYVSVSVNSDQRNVNISTDGGRLCRPYIIIGDDHKPLLTEEHVKQIERCEITFDDLVTQGIVEFIDVNESGNSLFAVYEKDIKMATTHLEIEPFTILGVCANVIPYMNHNQSPRNTYQCAMGKQAMGASACNLPVRADTLLYLLVYPQRPLCTTRAIRICHYEDLPAGQNATVAVMSFSGYDIEDALVLNKASLDRGFGRCLVNRFIKDTLRTYANQSSDRAVPPTLDPVTKRPTAAFAGIDHDGICRPGARLKKKDFVVSKMSPVVQTGESVLAAPRHIEYKISSSSYRGPVPAVVDRVLLTTNEEKVTMIKVIHSQCRRPELGDKFSSRHGQKGVCGIVVPQEDMPFSQQGMCPDLIMNPHGYPSRMTVGKLMELLSSKTGALAGRLVSSTAFAGEQVEPISQEIMQYGFNFLGKDILSHGATGEAMTAYIYFGPLYYQKLKHMVLDKMHARGRGPKSALTRQPTEGRARDGGLRLGEMERDCLIAYGVSNLINERLMISSDQFMIEVCSKCGLMGYNRWCDYCRSSETVSDIAIPYACKLLFQELQAMNIVPRFTVESQGADVAPKRFTTHKLDPDDVF